MAARVAVALVWVYAAYGKLKPQLGGFGWSINSIELSLAVFAATIDSYRILPSSAVTAAANCLPFIESLLGIWLLSLTIDALLGSISAAITICEFRLWRIGSVPGAFSPAPGRAIA